MTLRNPVKLDFWRPRVEVLRSVLNLKIAFWNLEHIQYSTRNRLKATEQNSDIIQFCKTFSSSRHPFNQTHIKGQLVRSKVPSKMLIFLEKKNKRALNRPFSPHQNISHHFHYGFLFNASVLKDPFATSSY